MTTRPTPPPSTRSRSTRGQQVVTLLTAVAGVIVGHGIAYLIAYPEAHQRSQVLHNTGHGYNDLARMLAVVADAIAAWAATVRGLRRRTSDRSPSVRLVFLRWLAPLQVLGFSTLEISERIVTGTPLSELVHGHEFVVGLVTQVAVAGIAVLALALTEHVAARVAAQRRESRPGRGRSSPLSLVDVPGLAGLRWWSAPHGRGPPLGVGANTAHRLQAIVPPRPAP